MNTLSKNRILEAGDEYLDKDGTWKPVPSTDLGLQVLFSPHKECRRPSEPFTPQQASSPASKPISPKQAADKIATPVAAESEKTTPVPTHSGTGDHSSSYLPTVVSRKAHVLTAQEITSRSLAKVTAEIGPTGPIEKAIEKAKASALISDSKEVRFPPSKYCYPIWTGRNGTFDCKAINLHRTSNDVIQIIPQGKRGPGNCIIEFPATVIPEITEWLKAQFVRAKK
jgi:hypothetical protein